VKKEIKKKRKVKGSGEGEDLNDVVSSLSSASSSQGVNTYGANENGGSRSDNRSLSVDSATADFIQSQLTHVSEEVRRGEE
jgi:hypothetical protein